MDTSAGVPGAEPNLICRYWQPEWGGIEAQFHDGNLIRLAFAEAPAAVFLGMPPTAPFPAPLQALLQSYFSGMAVATEDALRVVPIRLHGTPFQERVWAALTEIPYGQTRSYGQLARALGSAPRAVGQACKANPIAILVPCHRVLAAAGLGGYAGARNGPALARKEALLHLEGAI